MEVVIGIVIFAVICAVLGWLSGGSGLIGDLANIIWYLWSKLWPVLCVVIIIVLAYIIFF